MFRLSDVWPTPLTTGIFKALDTNYELPWSEDEDITPETLDLDYFFNHSGCKICSPVIDQLLSSAAVRTGKLTSADINALAGVIWARYKRNWAKLWATLSLEYNPIENYDRTEEKDGTDTVTETPTNWKETRTEKPTAWKETETQTPTNWMETVEGADTDNESTTTTQKYGFNSGGPVNDGIAVTKAKDKHTTEQTGTYETERERSGSYETETQRTGSYESETEYDTTLRIHGNIGVTTSQQMIESERAVWLWQFFDQVFKDVDSVLTIDFY